MNEHDLDLALHDLGELHVRHEAPLDLRQGVRAVPIETTQQRAWLPRFDTGGFTMLSAVKFIAAAAIVALFGGFLLAGILTTPQGDEMAPGAVTESPSPMTTEELLLGMVTEEVEPGAFRVINDGVRDLVLGPNADIVAGQDDGIWLLRGHQFYRLGHEDTRSWPSEGGPMPGRYGSGPGFRVQPDGTVWVLAERAGRYGRLHSSEGDGWTARHSPGRDVFAVEVAPDGKAWASWATEGGNHVGHLGPTGWQPLELVQPHPNPPRALVPDGANALAVTDSGEVYAVLPQQVVRFEDGVWRIHTLALIRRGVGADGTIWRTGPLSTPAGAPLAPGLERDEWGLVRHAGGTDAWWTRDELPDGGFGFGDQFAVAPDGSLWASMRQSLDGEDLEDSAFWIGDPIEDGRAVCDGVARFDGTTVDRFLPGQCITMDIAADGSVWVLAGEEMVRVPDDKPDQWVLADDATWDLYVITPEAVAATE